MGGKINMFAKVDCTRLANKQLSSVLFLLCHTSKSWRRVTALVCDVMKQKQAKQKDVICSGVCRTGQLVTAAILRMRCTNQCLPAN